MRKLYFSALCCLAVTLVNAQFTLNGTNALQLAPNEYQLTPQMQDQKGSMWNNTPMNLANDFILHVEFNFGSISETNPTDGVEPDYRTGADGIVFVLQNNGANSLTQLGGFGEEIGYGGINNSFAVEFDTWENRLPFSGSYDHGDPARDHVAFMSHGFTVHYGPYHYGTTELASGVEIEDGAWRPVTFMWDATAKQLTVTFNGNTYTYNGDVAALVGNGTAYWGFTSATGRGVNQHRVRILGCNNTVIPCGNKGKKVTICHIPPGNPANRHEICVAWSAVPAHLAHGDCLGMCNSSGGRTAFVGEEESHGVEMNVYPNPSRGNISVQVNHLDAKAELTITNGRGLVVERRNISASSQQLNFDLKKYGAGIYMVKLVNGDEIKTTKVLVQE